MNWFVAQRKVVITCTALTSGLAGAIAGCGQTNQFKSDASLATNVSCALTASTMTAIHPSSTGDTLKISMTTKGTVKTATLNGETIAIDGGEKEIIVTKSMTIEGSVNNGSTTEKCKLDITSSDLAFSVTNNVVAAATPDSLGQGKLTVTVSNLFKGEKVTRYAIPVHTVDLSSLSCAQVGEPKAMTTSDLFEHSYACAFSYKYVPARTKYTNQKTEIDILNVQGRTMTFKRSLDITEIPAATSNLPDVSFDGVAGNPDALPK